MSEEVKKYPKYSATLVAVLIIIDIFFSVVSSVNFLGVIGVAALVIASALFACLLILTRSLYVFLIFLPSFLISALVGGDLIFAFAGLVYVPLGFISAFGIKQRFSRTQIILRLSGGIAVFYVIALIFVFITSTGEFSPESIRDIITREASDFMDYYNYTVNQYSNNIAEIEVESEAEARVSEVPAMSETEKAAYVESIKAIIPAAFIIYCNAVSFFITFVFRIFYNIIVVQLQPAGETVKRKKIAKDSWRITVSFVSTIIFVLCIFLVMIFAHNIWVTVVISNIVYVLVPGLFIIGFYFIFGKIKLFCKNNYMSAGLVLFFLAIALLFFTSFVLMAVIFCGVYSIQVVEIKKLTEKIRKSFDDFGDDDD